MIKPLADALRDNDPIRAVIRETAVNSDGLTKGVTMPSQEAHEALIRSAYRRAGLNPAETGYVVSNILPCEGEIQGLTDWGFRSMGT